MKPRTACASGVVLTLGGVPLATAAAYLSSPKMKCFWNCDHESMAIASLTRAVASGATPRNAGVEVPTASIGGFPLGIS